MRVLVDGHNALFALRLPGETHEEQRRELLRRVAELAPRATVFFDARHAPHRLGSELGLSAVFCRDRDADAEILETVREAGEPREITVVSNDRELTGRAAQLGARVLRVHEFFRRSPGREAAPAEAGDRPRILRGRWRFVPADFGLPDHVDLDNPGDI
jgi:hypothetical protein